MTDSFSPKAAFDKAVEARINQLTALIRPEGYPNINELWKIAKDLEGIKLNLKMFGYELARNLRAAAPPRHIAEPLSVGLKSKACTQADLESDWAAYWAGRLQVPVIYHRKLWEYCYLLQALHDAGMLREGARGLGFGCGEEPVASMLVSHGCFITITDLAPEAAAEKGWTATNQHASSLEKSFHPHLVDRKRFDERTTLSYVDMNAIPDSLRGYDFCWSLCSLEHLGSIRLGLEFIENSLQTLKPGGIAVHTTEFSFLNDGPTIDNWATVLYQRKHLEQLAQRLTANGHEVAPLDFHVGNGPMDRFIDLPPYDHDLKGAALAWAENSQHLKLMLDGFATTCFGLVVRKAA